jgi:hypothetical protein
VIVQSLLALKMSKDADVLFKITQVIILSNQAFTAAQLLLHVEEHIILPCLLISLTDRADGILTTSFHQKIM